MQRKLLLSAALAVAGCSVYEASLLTGPLDGAGAADEVSEGGRSGGFSGSGGSGGTARAPEQGGQAGEGTGEAGEAAEGGDAGALAVDGGAGGEGGMNLTGGRGGNPGGAGGSASGASGQGGSAGDAGSGGSGASAGASGGAGAGSGGTSGAAGSAGSSGTSGSSGSSGDGGSAGAGETCTGATGCARLSVPLTAAAQRTFFVIDLPAFTDFSNATVTFRVLPVSVSGGRILAFAQHGGMPPGDYNLIQGGVRTLSSLSGWTSVSWNVAQTVPGFTFDKSVIKRIGLEVSGTGSTAWTNPTVLYLDEISISGPAVGPFPFSDATSIDAGTVQPNVLGIANNGGDFVPGSSVGWLP